MSAWRRGLAVGALAVLIGLVVRVLGKSDVPVSSGGWRQLEGPDFR